MFKHIFPNKRAQQQFFYRTILFAGDAALVWVAVRLAYFTRFQFPPFIDIFPITKGTPSLDAYNVLFWAAVFIWMMVFMFIGGYRQVNLLTSDEFLRVIRGVAVGWIVLIAAKFMYRGVEYSRLMLALSGGYTFVGIFGFREIVKILYARVIVRWWEPHQVLILGGGRMSKSIEKVLSRHPEIEVVHKDIHESADLERFLKSHSIREVFVGAPEVPHVKLISMSDLCDEHDIPFRIVPDILELRMGEVIIDSSLGMPTFQVKSAMLHGWTYFYKRLFDIVCSISIVSLMSIPLLWIAFLIWIDSKGKILLKQDRLGFRRKKFPFYKFRTMVPNADALLEELKKKTDRPGPVFKMKNDPRVTRVGKWLRKYSIDEVPQILNVLRGDMSLVGPRPQVLWEAQAYDEWAKKRLNVFPGITGLWQVSGRAQLSYEEMIDLDIYYIEHWSPGLDLKILLRTVPTILGSQGAY